MSRMAEGAPPRPRPRIGRARLPPVERAKLRPLVDEGGVQLRARFEHRRSADYASTRSLATATVGTQDQCLDDTVTSLSMSAKSCENIFGKEKHWSSSTRHLWRESTRSEEALYAAAGHDSPQKQTMQCVQSMGNVGLRQPTGAKARLAALLKKLSPRGLRRSRSQPSAASGLGDGSAALQCPWLRVEFSAENLLEGATCQDSAGSDRSFDLAVSEAQHRKEEYQRNLMTQNVFEDKSKLKIESPSTLPVQSKSVTPNILIAENSVGHSLISSSPSSVFGSKLILSRSLFLSASKPILKPKPALFQGGGGGNARAREPPPTAAAAAAAAAGRCGGGAGAGSLPASPRRRIRRAHAAHAPLIMASAESLGGGDAAAGHFPGSVKTFYDENKIHHENGLHKDQELGTLCNISGSIVPTGKLNSSFESPEYVRRTVRRFEDQEQDTGDTEFSSLPAVKKPSYLGISCSLSGYSSLTSYDSKVREGFRSRDKSPAPPPPRLLSSMPNKETQNGIGSLKASQKTPISPPSEKQPSPPTGSQSPLRRQIPTSPLGTQQNLSQSPGRYNEAIFNSTLEKNSFPVDEVDQAASSGKSDLHEKNMTMNSSLPTINVQTPLKRSPGAVRVTEFTCQTKSFIQTKTSSGEIQQVNSSLERSIIPLNGVHSELHADSASVNAMLEESPKSFVQQRIERLYGPGALGQGFLSRVRRTSSTPDEAPQQVSPVPSIPQLPVLRHLRPEFRAQLPLTSSSLSKSLRSLDTSSSPVPTTPAVDSPKYRSIDLTDFQHAAPNVPVMKAEASPLPSESSFFTDPDLTPVIFRPVASATDTLGKEVASEVVAEEDLSGMVEEKNGHHFLRVLHKEIERLNGLANQVEEELSSTEDRSDDVQGKLRSAAGKARLLVKQKLQQFEGLCIKNISQYPGEPFPTTAQDLEGFWDMVKLQIDHVDLMFLEIDSLRKNNWKETPESLSNFGTVNGSRRRQTTRHNPTKHGNGSCLPPAATCGGSRNKVIQLSSDKKKTDSARRSREEQALARKKMMEERRHALKAQQAKTEQHVEIYVASRNGK